MEVGTLFAKIGQDLIAKTKDWCGTGECAEFAERIIENANQKGVSIKDSFSELHSTLVEKISQDTYDRDWDDFSRGFLAGQAFGELTLDSLAKAEKAENLWAKGEYGYYQECVNNSTLANPTVSRGD